MAKRVASGRPQFAPTPYRFGALYTPQTSQSGRVQNEEISTNLGNVKFSFQSSHPLRYNHNAYKLMSFSAQNNIANYGNK